MSGQTKVTNKTNSTFLGVNSDGSINTRIQGTTGNFVDVNTLGELKEVNSDNILANQTNGTQKNMLVNSGGDIADITSTGSQYVTLQKNDGLIVGVDDSTSALNCIDYTHHKIHSGSHYNNCDFHDLANGETYDLLLVAPDTTKWTHLFWTHNFQLEGNLIILENVAVSTLGVSMPTINSNRNSLNSSGTLLYNSPTGVTGGVEICHQHIGSGKAFGGESRNDSEIILKRNTKYLFRVTNEAVGATNRFNHKFEWYEHTDKA